MMSFPVLEDPIVSSVKKGQLSYSEAFAKSFPSIANNRYAFIPFHERAFFPWKGLPYPHEQAKLLISLSKEEAEPFLSLQQAFCDDNGQVIPSIFCQEGSVPLSYIEACNHNLWQVHQRPVLNTPFYEPTLGFIRIGQGQTCGLITAAGCMTGLGSFLNAGAGILTYGPQLSPVGDCSDFGIAGRPECHEIDLQCGIYRYTNRLAKKLKRQTGIAYLSDAGYSGVWIDVTHTFDDEQIGFEASFKGPGSLDGLSWTFFGRGKSCVVAGSHKLSANSLDRYQGPLQPLELQTKEGRVLVKSTDRASLEVIPLAGDQSYWGADFLIAIEPENKSSFSCLFSRPN